MSASTNRKTRQTELEAGTHKKTLAQQKEDAKNKKDKIKWIAVTAVIVVFFAFVIFVNTGAMFRCINGMTVTLPENTELKTESVTKSFTVAEVNCAYNMQYMQYTQLLSSIYGDYAQYYTGIDTSKPFSEQACSLSEEEGYTWDDYFSEAAEDLLTQLTFFEEYARVNGITLTDEDIASIDESIASFDAAKDYGYGSPDKLVTGNYGKGTNIKVLRSMLELQQLATRVQTIITDSYEYTAEQLATKYESVKDTYDKITYSYVEIAAAVEETEDSEETAAPTEEALNEAKATVDSMLAKMNDEGMSLADAAKAVDSAAEVKEQKDIAGSSLESALSEWLLDAERKEGDVTTIKGTESAYIVVFTSRNNNQEKTDESGDMNYCDYVADSLLRSEDYSAWSEENITPTTDAVELKAAFGMSYVGR